MRPGTAFLLALAPTVLVGTAARSQEQQEVPQARFGSVIDVLLYDVVVRVVDYGRRPILGLGPQDFRVLVGDREIPVFAVEWVTSAPTPAAPTGELPLPGPGQPPAPAASNGRQVVFFVQADLHPLRLSGHLRQRPYNEQLLASLDPADRIAVVAFDSHLKLWQDWTTDRQAVLTAIRRAVRYGDDPPPAAPAAEPTSLARHLDFAEAKKAASPERALELTARALAEIPGEKVILFQGWGMGRYGAFGFSLTGEFFRAAEAVRTAQASVHAIDITSADGHTLALGLSGIAAATDGLYFSNYEFPSRVPKALNGLIDGHYELTLDFTDLPDVNGILDIRLQARKGKVLFHPVLLRVVDDETTP